MIREELDKLDEKSKSVLLYAFENGLSQHINLNKSRFLGVNISETDTRFVIKEKVGVWSLGLKKN